MSSTFITDCYCADCGRAFKGPIDFDRKPARFAGRYQSTCTGCHTARVNGTLAEHLAAIRKRYLAMHKRRRPQ